MNVAAITNPSSPASVARLTDLAGSRSAAGPRKPITSASMRSADPAEQRSAVASQFEAIIVRQLLGKTMSSMLGSEKSGPAANVYGDMLTDAFSQQLTAGSGFGLGRMLEKQLTPRGKILNPPATPAATAAPSVQP
jgi:Rod binding domain-containing protein